MTYALSLESQQALRGVFSKSLFKLVPGGFTAVVLNRPPSELRAAVYVEDEGEKLAVLIDMHQSRHTLRLQAGDPANAEHIREQLEAIANGTADTAETGAIGTPTAPAREPFALCDDDEASLRHLARIGGTRHLQCGVSITVHNALNATRRDALVTTPAGTTHLHAGTPGKLYAVAAQHIEDALTAA
ncbi:hypothetical protein ACRS3X_25460 [Ectopseudomonas hydrolytica]|uniref:hypothetical protein n=1 Tax=Ectopseudomonas hydrolytica TaxID=2493633 RepID=UPI003EE4162D